MKRAIAGIIAGLVLGAAGTAGAATVARSFYANDIVCKTMSGGVGCLKNDGSGYAVGIHDDFVFVVNEQGKRVFTRYQP